MLARHVLHADTRFRLIFFHLKYLGIAFCDQSRAVGKIFASLIGTWKFYSKAGVNCLNLFFLCLKKWQER